MSATPVSTWIPTEFAKAATCRATAALDLPARTVSAVVLTLLSKMVTLASAMPASHTMPTPETALSLDATILALLAAAL